LEFVFVFWAGYALFPSAMCAGIPKMSVFFQFSFCHFVRAGQIDRFGKLKQNGKTKMPI
jgi:hypothetical protein